MTSRHHDVARAPQYFKYGTIERFISWRGTPDGRRLHPLSKAIGVYLLSRAITGRGFTCIVSESEVCDVLAPMDPKTFRKYVGQLVDFGLVKTDRGRSGGTKRYDVTPIYERFGEQRADPVRKVTSLQNGKVSRTADRDGFPEVRESFPYSPEPFPPLERESVPISLEVSTSSEASATSSLLGARARRLGLTITSGLEREIVATDHTLTVWGFTQRRKRWFVKRFGIIAVAGAIGYVLQQQSLHPGTIKRRDGLFVHALAQRWTSELPGLTIESSAHHGITAPPHHGTPASRHRGIASRITVLASKI